MFNNRAAQITFHKTNKTEGTPTTNEPRFTDAQITKIENITKRAFVGLVGAAVVLKATDALCEIAINIAPKN